jgi:predicted amidophosphoribosyltransferase
MAIIHLVGYHKYWLDKRNGVKNPNFDKNSELILALKNHEDRRFNSAVSHYYHLLKTELQKHLAPSEPIYAAIVPSSRQGQYSHGLGFIVRNLRNDFNIVNSKNPLYRRYAIDKLAQGGSRSISVHLDSVGTINDHIGRGQKFLLLDDVTTTGGSLTACKQLLEAAGAGEVLAIALAKTI